MTVAYLRQWLLDLGERGEMIAILSYRLIFIKQNITICNNLKLHGGMRIFWKVFVTLKLIYGL